MQVCWLELFGAVGKLAVAAGESWRLDHPELMDAYSACLESFNEPNHNQQAPEPGHRNDADATPAQSRKL